MIPQHNHHISALIRKCRHDVRDLDRQIELLIQINLAIPRPIRLELPSLLTDDYVRRALDLIEERLIKTAMTI